MNIPNEMSGRSGHKDENQTTPSSVKVVCHILWWIVVSKTTSDPKNRLVRIHHMKKYIFTLISSLALTACIGQPSFNDASLGGPKLNLEDYFDGHVTAQGQFQDIFGKVRQRFDVDINGAWDGTTLTLVEDFTYSDNTTEQRIWRLTKTGADRWSGTADGVIGTAIGVENENRFNWKYRIDLPSGDKTTTVAFDDWMWLVDDQTLFNKAYMKRWGVTVGDVFIVFKKR
jgi:hypothetical protein